MCPYVSAKNTQRLLWQVAVMNGYSLVFVGGVWCLDY